MVVIVGGLLCTRNFFINEEGKTGGREKRTRGRKQEQDEILV